MATYVDQAYYGWPHEELPRQDDSQEVPASQLLDHGSISFGRFAYDSLSWEKRSVFTYNKCQEELEKFKSPGLVAKKKAYFEEYYKRIRAMKALQESQPTEIMLDYSGDGSISSQTGEEDETTVQLENLRGGVADTAAAFPEEDQIEIPVEQGTDFSEAAEVQIGHSDPELMIPYSDSSGNNFEEHEQVDKTIHPHEMQHLDMDISVHEQVDKTIHPHEMRHLDMDISAHESLTISIEESKQRDLSDLDDKRVSKENSITVTNIESKVASGETTSSPTNSKVGDVELKPAHNMVPRKVMPAVGKYKDSVSVLKPKEPSTPTRNGLKLEDKAKLNIQKSSRGPKCPIQQTTVKSGSLLGSKKATTADKVSRNNKSTTVASHRPLREVHSNVTIPHPFSLATDRRATVPPGSREGLPKLVPKSLNQRSLSAVKGKDTTNIQSISKQTVISSSMKSRGLENKSIRGHEEKKKAVTLDSQSASLKARGTNAIGPVKARSLNLPPANKFSSNSGADMRCKDGIRSDRSRKGKHEVRVTEFQQADTKVFTPSAAKLRTARKAFTPQSANLRSETKKAIPSWMANSSFSGRRPQCGDQSLDGKKPRQEKPRWR